MKLLLAAPEIDVNGANANGHTPLVVAPTVGHFEVVKLLLGAPRIETSIWRKMRRGVRLSSRRPTETVPRW